MRLHSDFSYVVIAALRADDRHAGRKYWSIARATVTHGVSDSCTENSVFVQHIHLMRRRNKAHSSIKNHIYHHKTIKEVTRKALYRVLKSTISGCDMHHIACRYGAYRKLIWCISHDTGRSVAFPIFQNEQPARIFPSVRMLPHTVIQRHSGIRHTSCTAPDKCHSIGMKYKKADFTAGFP